MSLYQPRDLDALYAEASGFLVQSVPGAVVGPWPNTFTVVAKVLALLNDEHERRRKWLCAQQFPSTADENWLARHAYERGLDARIGAPATGSITLVAPTGSVIPAGTRFSRANGALYLVPVATTAVSGAATVPVEATEDGALGNAPLATVLTLTSDSSVPVGVAATGTVLAPGLTGGTDPEDTETLRGRVRQRLRGGVVTGTPIDYIRWVSEALPAVRNAYVESFTDDPRAVWVQFTVSDQPNGIPTPQQVTLVQAYLNNPARRPLTARAFVTAPVALPVPVTISGLAPNLAIVRAAVETELAATFADRAQPGFPSGASLFRRSWLSEAISRAVGEDAHDLVAPAANIIVPPGQIPTLGPVTWL